MGYDYEFGRFTPKPHELQPAQMLPTVLGMQPGDVRYIQAGELLCDEKGQLYIGARKRVYTLDETIRVGYETEETKFMRLICTADGLVGDRSHENIKVWDDSNRLRPISSQTIAENQGDYIPLAYVAYNPEEWQLVLGAMQNRYRIELEVEDTSLVVEEIHRLIEEARAEGYVGDDDDEEAA